MKDLISRQAAIDMLKNRWKKTRHYEGIGDDIAEECELYLKQVPPAQPSVSKEEMVGDTISRQAAIDATWFEPSYTDPLNVLTEVRDRLKVLPSTQHKHKPGKWIPVTNGRGGHECSLCHSYAPSFQSGDEWLTDYCPCCGAGMREVE